MMPYNANAAFMHDSKYDFELQNGKVQFSVV